MRILVIRYSSRSDVAMAFPAVCEAAERHIENEYYFLTEASWQKVPHPDNLHILACDLKQLKGVKGMLRLFKIMHSVHPDKVIDFQHSVSSCLADMVLQLCGVHITSLSRKRILHPFITNHVAMAVPVTHMYAFLMGVPVRSVVPPRWRHIEQENAIGIAPYSEYPTKIYHEEYMRTIIDHFAAVPGLKVYLFGTNSDVKGLKAFAYGHDNVQVVNEFNLELHEEIDLMRHLKLMLTMDSTAAHLATLAAIPVVTIWGGTTPAGGYSPWHRSSINTFIAQLECQPCSIQGSKKCPRGNGIYCMRWMKPEPIIARMEEILEEEDIESFKLK